MKVIKLLMAIAFFTSFAVSGQLTSFQAVPSMIGSQTSSTGFLLKLEIEADDLSQIGIFSVVVYDYETGNPLLAKNLTASQIEDQALIHDGKIVFELGEIDEGGHYIIKTDVQNLQLAYLPQVVVEYP